MQGVDTIYAAKQVLARPGGQDGSNHDTTSVRARGHVVLEESHGMPRVQYRVYATRRDDL